MTSITNTLYDVNTRDLSLTGKTVRHMQRQRRNAEEHVAEYFFTDCLKRIMRQAKMGHTKALYRVPEHQFNLMPNGRMIPLYKSQDVAEYLIRWFRQEGFHVQPDAVQSTLLRFSWRRPATTRHTKTQRPLAEEARQYMQQRKALRHGIFNTFVANCKRKIRKAVRLDPKSTQMWYEVPLFKLGMPLYTTETAVQYVTASLEASEFCVTRHNTLPNVLSISWQSGF